MRAVARRQTVYTTGTATPITRPAAKHRNNPSTLSVPNSRNAAKNSATTPR